MDTSTKRLEVENEQGWLAEAETMPTIPLLEGWQMTPLPAYSNVVVRFTITLPSGLVKSVFFDSRCTFGKWRDKSGRVMPYWEVSPYGGKCGRCGKYDIDGLMEMIAYED